MSGAMVDRVRETVHFEIFDVNKPCNMAQFARSHIPGFRPELGYYGYFEFKQEEFLEPEKKVVLVHKV